MNNIKTFENFNSFEVKKIKSFKTPEGKFSVYDIDDVVIARSPMFTVLEDKKGWIVRNAYVPEYMQKKGIATSFYIKMNKESLLRTGCPLRSTPARKLLDGSIVHELSDDGLGLWDSLVRKGLAYRHSNKNYLFNN